MMTKKVAVLVGSLREGSFTRQVAEHAAKLFPEGYETTFIEIGDLPFYNEDLDTEGNVPEAWTRFRSEINEVDAVLFATPEYNRTIPATIKNALDVGSRPYGSSVWNGKPAAIISVSPSQIGGFGANHHLRQPLVFLNMPVLQQPEAYIGNVMELLGDNGEIVKSDTVAFVQSIVDAFVAHIETNS